MWVSFPVLPGCILSLSAQCNRDNNEVKVLALCAGEEDRKKDGSLLTLLSLPTQNLGGTKLKGLMNSLLSL